MKFIRRSVVLAGFVMILVRVSTAESLADAAARSGLSVESQAQGADIGIVIGEDTASHDRFVAVFRPAGGGSWRMDHRDPICGRAAVAEVAAPVAPQPAQASPPSAGLAAVEAALDARSQSTALSIPAGRSLSDGTVRAMRSDIRSWLRREQMASAPDEGYRSIQTAFEALISDVGWIDVLRFGVPTACDAASIVALSGNRRLMEGALPAWRRA